MIKTLFERPKLSLEDLSVILQSILLNVERVENNKKKTRSHIDKRRLQKVINDYTLLYFKIKDLQESVEDKIIRDSQNTEVELSRLW